MEYAIIAIGNHQYLLKPGDKIQINGVYNQAQLDKLVRVLAIKNEKLEVGTPALTTKLDLKLVEHTKSQKLDIATYKSKSRYRRHTGHRQAQTIIQLVDQTKATPKRTPNKVVSKPTAKPTTQKVVKKAK